MAIWILPVNCFFPYVKFAWLPNSLVRFSQLSVFFCFLPLNQSLFGAFSSNPHFLPKSPLILSAFFPSCLQMSGRRAHVFNSCVFFFSNKYWRQRKSPVPGPGPRLSKFFPPIRSLAPIVFFDLLLFFLATFHLLRGFFFTFTPFHSAGRMHYQVHIFEVLFRPFRASVLYGLLSFLSILSLSLVVFSCLSFIFTGFALSTTPLARKKELFPPTLSILCSIHVWSSPSS